MNPTSTPELVNEEISFAAFPLWQGVRDRPGGLRQFPFRIKLDAKGYIRQSSDPEVEQLVVEAYQDPGYTMPTPPPGASRWANQLGDMYYDFAIEHVPDLAGKSAMEIGAGSLYLAQRFVKEADVSEYIIIDPSVKEKTTDERIQIIPKYFGTDLDLGDTRADFILSLNTLEHVTDPFDFLVKANEVLRSNESRFVLIFPDIEEQFRRGDINALHFEHLNYFSEKSASALITHAGLEIVTLVKKLDTLFYVLKKGGSANPNVPADTDQELFNIAVQNFAHGLTPILSVIEEAQSDGKTVAFHGACNGMNTLFALGDIDTSHILLFDGDESKEGAYVPSCPVPILHASSPRYKEADLVVVTAVTFFDDIRSFLESEHGIPSDKILPFSLTPDDAAAL